MALALTLAPTLAQVCMWTKRYMNAKLNEMAELNSLKVARPPSDGDRPAQVEAT